MRRLVTLALVLAAAAVTAAAQFTITTTTVPSAILGQPYAPQALQATGDQGPFTWSVVTGSIPSNFVLGTDGTFCYGFPTVGGGPPACLGTGVQSLQGVYNFTLQVMSQSTAKATTQPYTMYVVQTLQITTTSLKDAPANQPYSVQLQTIGGTGQFTPGLFTWSVIAGALPTGIGLDPTTGLVSGTAPNANALYTFTIQVLDQATQATATQQLSINVTGGVVITTATPLPVAIGNMPYPPPPLKPGLQFTADNAGGLVWSVVPQQLPQNQLPQNFSISASGLLTGFALPAEVGIYNFQVQLTNPELPVASPPVTTKIFTLYVTLGPLGIKEAALPTATQNVAYHAPLTAQGGVPPYTFSFDVANPQGLNINPSTGAISGTPANAGSFPIPITLKDSIGEVFSQTYSLAVFPAVSISTSSLANGSPGVAYGATLVAAGGVLPYQRWDVVAGNLPTGLSIQTLTNGTGQISGTPTVAGAFQFTVQVTDFGGTVATKVFTITIGTGQSLTITTTSLPDGTLNQVYSQTLGATGGTQPYTWSIAPSALPTGLQLNAATGVISGTPTTAGNFAFSVVVSDALQAVARTSLSINVPTAGSQVTITSGDFTGTVLVALSQTLTATGGTPPYTWSSGNLPNGLTLAPATGVISGTPTAPGTSQVTVTATDARNQTGSRSITITILVPPAPPTSISLGSTTQPTVGLTTGSPYPLDIVGSLTLTFSSSVGGVDGGEVRFVNGTRSLQFTVPANQTSASLTAIVTGTVAGTITLTITSLSAGGQDITPSPAPTKTVTIDPAVPVINSVTLQQVTGGLSVVVMGYSNTREVSSGSFTFTVSGSPISAIIVPLTSAYATWFNSTASNSSGGKFTLTVPFSVTGSAATAVTKVTVTLTNRIGASAAVSSP